MEEEKRIRKMHSVAAISALVIGIMLAYTILPSIVVEEGDDGEWNVIARFNSASAAENSPATGESGWLSTFILDYAEDPDTCLASNASGGSYDTWTNVSGYVYQDDKATDLKSEDPGYFVVRCRFNDTVKDGADFMSNRCRVTLTVSGDETISGVRIWGHNSSAGRGGGVVSHNDSSEGFIYINFYWDDGVDGYRITDDGTLTWSIVVEAKY